jgi:hypothetical protein
MRTIYRGFDIAVWRDWCLGGWEMLYYSITRLSDGRECSAGFTYDESPVRTYMRYMKERVDAELAEDDPWNERAEAAELFGG